MIINDITIIIIIIKHIIMIIINLVKCVELLPRCGAPAVVARAVVPHLDASLARPIRKTLLCIRTFVHTFTKFIDKQTLELNNTQHMAIYYLYCFKPITLNVFFVNQIAEIIDIDLHELY